MVDLIQWLWAVMALGYPPTLAAAIEQYHDENGIIWPRLYCTI